MQPRPARTEVIERPRHVARRCIEADGFPFERISEIAELESWRKEIHRPIYHVHKWWAQRLGSVFRAIIVGTFMPSEADVLRMFYRRTRLGGAVVFDPFMGCGTTVGEALKLGARAIGWDINPVAHFAARNAVALHPRKLVLETFRAIENDIADEIRQYYTARLPEGSTADVLYYFWVKVVPCLHCGSEVDLFSSYLFARHAYPGRSREARAVCPNCGDISIVGYDSEEASCGKCGKAFNPLRGPASGTKAWCTQCERPFLIARAVQATDRPPAHRLYAKLVLKPNGLKEYVPADDHDRALYEQARAKLHERRDPYPVAPIEPGYNTDQVLNYCYRYWHEMFNDRQLLCLSLLAERIREIPDAQMRDLFACLFSGTLEFNNMFASYKGEGTGAVRHMFSHHILKPERMPLEANVWGTPKSSGAFSTLFRSRLLRALDYSEQPFEVRVQTKGSKPTARKVYGLSLPLGRSIARDFEEFEAGGDVYLSCGDSAITDLASESIDGVITDPPFFDNVHYSQLADFFYVWQRHIARQAADNLIVSTRSPNEVQHSDCGVFTQRLGRVWSECRRVLKPDGLLVFTYHHSRQEGWHSLLESLMLAGFVITATHPVKAEMSVAAPKHQAREPIDLDIIVVCRKRDHAGPPNQPPPDIVPASVRAAQAQIDRLTKTGRRLSRNDVRVVLTAHVIRLLSWFPDFEASLQLFESSRDTIEQALTRLHAAQAAPPKHPVPKNGQLALI